MQGARSHLSPGTDSTNIMIESNETSALAWNHWEHSARDVKMPEIEGEVITFIYQYDWGFDLRCFIPESVKYFVMENILFNLN